MTSDLKSNKLNQFKGMKHMDYKAQAFICLINGTNWPNVMFLNKSSMIIMSDKGAMTLKIISEVNNNTRVLVLMMKITERC